jgi:Flp pilus assembly protein TadD
MIPLNRPLTMKTILKVILVQFCCLPLFVTDAMARDNDKRSGGRSSEASRPNVRPASGDARNPITHSKVSRPAATPSRPSSKPVARPSVSPQKPAARPSVPDRPQAKPAQPDRPQNKPAERPNIPNNRPQTKPAERPNRPDRPETKPAPPNRPQTKPAERPNLPGNRPQTKPAERPNLPGNRPNKPAVRPETKPGNVTYPKPNRPQTLPGNVNRPNQKPVVRPGQNTKPVKRPNFDNNKVNINSGNKTNNNWWQSNKTVNNKVINNNNRITNIRGGDTNIQINNNFKKNVNWSTNQRHWGYNPWWNRPATRPWYGGSWNCGWNNSYRRHHHHHHYYGGYRPLPGYSVHYHYGSHHNDWSRAIGWGLVGWGLGKLIFDSGYQTYSNPYPAQPVPSSTGAQVTYTQPITVIAAQSAPAESEADNVTEKSESLIAESQAAFKQRDYLKALDFANKAVGEAPGDGALHEYRALVLFALGKHSEAAGVLNPVLAGGPGWDWTTMIGLYGSQETYMNQFKGLQAYSASRPDAADARFLLGYHYMVCGYLTEANAEFAEAARLQPADTVSAQLRDLTAASSNNGDDDEAEDDQPAEDSPPPPPPVPLEKLSGTWVSDKGAQGTVTLAFKDDGKFLWTFTKDDKANEFGGEYSMNDSGLLVLDAEDSQMVASVELPKDNELKFVLSGGPPGDPGLIFAKN